MIAAHKGNIEIVELLLIHGADGVHKKESNGWNALKLAKWYNCIEIFEMIEKYAFFREMKAREADPNRVIPIGCCVREGIEQYPRHLTDSCPVCFKLCIFSYFK